MVFVGERTVVRMGLGTLVARVAVGLFVLGLIIGVIIGFGLGIVWNPAASGG
jgi:hypothetical protein